MHSSREKRRQPFEEMNWKLKNSPKTVFQYFGVHRSNVYIYYKSVLSQCQKPFQLVYQLFQNLKSSHPNKHCKLYIRDQSFFQKVHPNQTRHRCLVSFLLFLHWESRNPFIVGWREYHLYLWGPIFFYVLIFHHRITLVIANFFVCACSW
jgi:hypothetical protein